MSKHYKDVVRDQVAGAARALWSHLGEEVKVFLAAAPGARILHYQAVTALNSDMSLMGYAMLCTQRRQVANEARYLVMNRGAASGWLYGARPGQIVDAGEHARRADENLGKFKEVHAAPGERVYTLAELREAYRQGFLAAADDEKRAIRHIADDAYDADRDAALGAL